MRRNPLKFTALHYDGSCIAQKHHSDNVHSLLWVAFNRYTKGQICGYEVWENLEGEEWRLIDAKGDKA